MKTAKTAEIVFGVMLSIAGSTSAQNVQPSTPDPDQKTTGTDARDVQINIRDADQQEADQDIPAFASRGYFGSRAGEKSFLSTRFNFMEGAETGVASSGYDMQTQFSGGLDVRRIWRFAQFDAAYQGGADFYSGKSNQNTSFHTLALAQTFEKRRSSFSITDYFNYLPNSSFGAIGLNTTPSSSASSTPLSVPEQALVISNSPSIANTVGGTWTYVPNIQNSLTVSGSYELLRYVDIDNHDSNAYSISTEYEHAMGSSGNRIGVEYVGNLIRYQQLGVDLNTHSFLGEYRRNIHRHFALRIAAGPEYTSGNGLGNGSSMVTPAIEVEISRLWRTAEASIVYIKSVTEGAGLLIGSKSDLFEVYARRRFNRNWEGSFMAGYAHNGYLQPSFSNSYNSETFGVLISRRVTRRMQLFLQYNLQYQDAVTGMNVNQMRQIAGIGFTLTPRVLALH